MPIPSLPSFIQVPNTLGQGLRSLKTYHKFLNNGLTNLTKVTKLTSKRVKDVAKTANTAKETTDFLKQGNFKKVNPKLGNAIGFALSLASIGLSFMTINHVGKLQGTQITIDNIQSRDIDTAFSRSINNALSIKTLREQLASFINSYKTDKDRLRADISGNSSNITDLRSITNNAKKQANDALYEVRAGREKIESKILDVRQLFNQLRNETASQNLELATRIEEARKVGNDALYEVRAGRQSIEAEIQSKFTAAKQLANDALYESRLERQKLEASFGQELNNLRTAFNNQIFTAKSSIEKEVNRLFNNTNNIIIDATRRIRLTEKQVQDYQRQLLNLERKIRLLPDDNFSTESNLEPLVNRLINNNPRIQGLLAALKAANVKLDRYDITLPIYDKAIKNVGHAVQIIDGRITKLEQGIELKELGITNVRLIEAERAIDKSNIEIEKIKKQFDNGSPMDQKQFNDIISQIGLIPPMIARVPDNTVRKMRKPLTWGQAESAASSAICKSTNGGCMSKALGDTANTVNRNTNNVGNGLLDKLNASANAAQLALLKIIDRKLGAQIVGGISGQVVKNFERVNQFINWLKLDRILNVLTWMNTTHNAYMLSSSVAETLFSAIDNVGNVLFQDISGLEIDTKKSISTYFDNMAKAMFGVENWQNFTTKMKTYNRIYQAGANVINSVRSIVDSVRNVSEFIAENTGKIGNALMNFGAIASNAFPKMPEQVNAQSVWIQRLENLENAASGIEMITSEVLSTTENLNEIQKQVEAFNEGIKSLEPKEREDNQPVKERDDDNSRQSQSPNISISEERSG